MPKQIRKISYQEFETLYKKYITVDFPVNERRPLHSIQKLFKKGIYTCLVYEEGNTLQAYACLIQSPDQREQLLDYFAVMKNQRGSGIGTRFLQALRISPHLKDTPAQGIILECDMPSKAKDQQEKTIRTRRIQFYERSGALLTPVAWNAFGVDYNLLWLPLENQPIPPSVEQSIKAIYSQTMPSFLCKKCTYTYNLPI